MKVDIVYYDFNRVAGVFTHPVSAEAIVRVLKLPLGVAENLVASSYVLHGDLFQIVTHEAHK